MGREYQKITYPDKNGYTVDGIILNVEHFTLRTPAVVVDAFLGHVDALDCYAQKIMNDDIDKARLENAKREKDMLLDEQRLAIERQKSDLENQKMQIIQDTLKGLIDKGLFAEAGDLIARAFSNAPITQVLDITKK